MALTLWDASCWAICFKIWQTAYEIQFLFRRITDEHYSQILAKYWIINIVGYFLAVVPRWFLLYFWIKQSFKAMTSVNLLNLIGCFYTTGFLIGALIRMRASLGQIPILR